jgi:tRNA (cytidine/uridine-2'-O-)-methyltransferase
VSYSSVAYQPNDTLLFGPETRGIPDDIRNSIGLNNVLRLPMYSSSRSLNLSNTVAIVTYEAWRQLGFDGSQ